VRWRRQPRSERSAWHEGRRHLRHRRPDRARATQARALEVHERLRERHVRITIPVAVLAEWWRGRTDDREDILATLEVELDVDASRAASAAGEALAEVQTKRHRESCPSKFLVDAIVMASASLRGDVVFTCDFDDLSLFSRRFPGVRLLVP
jgi:hypothetical protein